MPVRTRPLPWLLLALLSLGAGLGLRDPSPPDEPRFVLAARHMVESGNWLLPRRGSELYAHKPPLFMWAQAAGFRLSGSWRIGFLLPSLAAAMLTLILVYDLGRRLWNRRIGLLAMLALLSTLQFGLQAKRAQIDMLLVAMTTLALWALLLHFLRGPKPGLLGLGGFAAGLGTVTKGVGFLPLLLILPVAWGLRDRPGPRRPWRAAGLLAGAFLAGTAVWLLPLGWTAVGGSDPALRQYLHEILFRQTAIRYADAWHHLQPAWYYLQVIATMWLPGALLLPWLLPAWRRRWRRGDARLIALLGWSLLVLLFFSASPGKREVYIFPALPALCLAAAPMLPGLLRRRGVQRVLCGWLLLLATALLAGAGGGLVEARWAQRLVEQRGLLEDEMRTLVAWVAALGAGALGSALWGLRGRAGAATLACSLLLFAGYGLGIAPALDASSSARRLMIDVRARIGAEAELGLVGWREQHLLQARGAVAEFGFEAPLSLQWQAGLAWLREAPERRWLFVLDRELPDCVERPRTERVGRSNRRDWLLVPGPAAAGCTVADDARAQASAPK
ncbi:MAG: ArnT family glycosyltransferase [Gammaproteobacteria bacterium]